MDTLGTLGVALAFVVFIILPILGVSVFGSKKDKSADETEREAMDYFFSLNTEERARDTKGWSK